MSRSTPLRCSAANRHGDPCRQIPIPGSDPPLCMIHAGLSRLQEVPPDRRCTATTRAGHRCQLWALPDSDPPRCGRHDDHHAPGPDRRCTATTLAGRQCRQWAVHDSDPPLCNVHAGLTAPGPGQRCTATTLDGARCRQPATAGTDPPRCYNHAGRHWPPPEARRCTVRLPNGDRCGGWAMRDSDPPLCATYAGCAGFPVGHLYGVTHGLLISRLLPEDLARMEEDRRALEEGRLNLDEELFACRYIVHQLAIATQPDRLKELTVPKVNRYFSILFRGLETIAIVLRAKRELEGYRPQEKNRQAAKGTKELDA